MKDFNLHGYLRNNRLLTEGVSNDYYAMDLGDFSPEFADEFDSVVDSNNLDYLGRTKGGGGGGADVYWVGGSKADLSNAFKQMDDDPDSYDEFFEAGLYAPNEFSGLPKNVQAKLAKLGKMGGSKGQFQPGGFSLNESVGGYRDIKALREEDLGKASDNLSVGDKLIKQNGEELEISKLDANNVWLKTQLGGRDAQWTRDGVEDLLKAGKLKWHPANNNSSTMSEDDSITSDPGWEYNDDDVNDQQFESDFDQLLMDIEEGYGWIDPEYVQETWENSSDIPFDSVAHKVYGKLIDAGILFYSDANDPEKPGKRVTSLNQLEEGYGDAPPEGPNSFLPTDQDLPGDEDWEANDPDAEIIDDFVQGMRPYYEKDPSFIKRVIDALRGKGFGAKMYDAGFRMNEGSDDIDYADYGVDPNDPDADIIVSFMQDMRDINNMKDPSFIDNFKDWLKGLKSNYQFNKKFKNSPFKMHEDDLEEKKPVSDDQRKAIWASYNNEAKEKGAKEKPKAKGKLKEGKIRPSSSEFTWDI